MVSLATPASDSQIVFVVVGTVSANKCKSDFTVSVVCTPTAVDREIFTLNIFRVKIFCIKKNFH